MASTKKRDLPGVCLLLGVLFAFGALTFGLGWKLDFVSRGDLQRVSGVVKGVQHTNLPRAGPKIHIYIQDGASYHHLTQDDLSWKVPALKTVRVGDSVVAYVKPDPFGRDLDWLWSMERDGQSVLSYEQVSDYLLTAAVRMRPVAYGSAVIALILVIASLILRKQFGSWTSAT